MPEPADVTWERPERHDRRADAERFRALHPELVVSDPEWEAHPGGGRWTWQATLAGGPTFTSWVDLDLGSAPAAPTPAPALGRALAAIDALSYWKAAASPRLCVEFALPGSLEWWQRFIAGGMGEFLWQNGLDPDWLPALEATGFEPLPDAETDDGDTVLLHSGGKDSIVSGLLLAAAGARVRPVTYQPTAEATAVVVASAPPGGWSAPPATIGRRFDPQLLDLNAVGHLNGHTPYSAWLAVAAAAVAELAGSGRVAAGNSASDDEPNITGRWRGEDWRVNHQWSKSAAFESAWADLGGAGHGRRYASPLRPMLELAVVAGIVATDPPGTRQALSCNRSAKAGRPGEWCGRCPKCAWMAVAIGAVAGRRAAVDRLGVDVLADPANGPLLVQMCGRRGPVPFECAGLPMEVRACLRELEDEAAPALASLSPSDLDDGDAPPSVEDLVARLQPAPLLDAAEHAAVADWVSTALG